MSSRGNILSLYFTLHRVQIEISFFVHIASELLLDARYWRSVISVLSDSETHKMAIQWAHRKKAKTLNNIFIFHSILFPFPSILFHIPLFSPVPLPSLLHLLLPSHFSPSASFHFSSLFPSPALYFPRGGGWVDIGMLTALQWFGNAICSSFTWFTYLIRPNNRKQTNTKHTELEIMIYKWHKATEHYPLVGQGSLET